MTILGMGEVRLGVECPTCAPLTFSLLISAVSFLFWAESCMARR